MIATWRTKTVTYTEYLVPRDAPIGELVKAMHHAWVGYCTATGHDPINTPGDDWARVDHDDENVIIRFEHTEVKP